MSRHLRRGTARGFTLIEALTATAVLSVAITGAALVLQTAAVHHHNGKLLADAQAEARTAADVLAGDLLAAGVGGRIAVVQGGTRRLISAIHGFGAPPDPSGGLSVSAPTFTMDTPSPATPPSTTVKPCGRDLPPWVTTLRGTIVPSDVFIIGTHRNATFDAANFPLMKGTRSWTTAAATSLSPATLTVDAVSGLTAGDLLLATDFQTSTLLTDVTLNAPSTVNVGSLDRAAGLVTNDPLGRRPFKAGTALLPARVVHYYVCADAEAKSVNLYRSFPVVCPNAPSTNTDPVFCDEYNTDGGVAGTVVARNILDLDLRYVVDVPGQGNPSDLSFTSTLPPEAANAAAVRQVRIAVRGYGANDPIDTSGTSQKVANRANRPYAVTVGVRNNLLNGYY